MAYTVGKGRPPKHTQFKKGQSGNPQGARRHHHELKANKRLIEPEFEEFMVRLLTGTIADIQAVRRDKTASTLQVWLAAICEKAAKKGDVWMLEPILNRLIGKPGPAVEPSKEPAPLVHFHLT